MMLPCSQFRDAVAARFPRGTVTSGAACIACSQSRERWVRELGAASPQWVENYCALPAALPPLQSVAEEVMKRQGTGQWCYTLAAKQPCLCRNEISLHQLLDDLGLWAAMRHA